MKHLCFIALLVVLLAFPSDVRADVAPPFFPPGSNPQPGTEVTQVRMVAETVVIEVQKDTTPRGLGRAHVTADFTMRNLGTVEESMGVLFPITGNDGRGNYPEIQNLRINVNGNQVQHQRANYPEVNYPYKEMVPWAEFDVTFPVGQDVSLRVEYDLQASGYYPSSTFYYILETGAGWKDTIGSADVILRLPYEASPQNVLLDTSVGWGETTSGGVFDGNEVRWHFENFEPGKDQLIQNMEFLLVAPSAWQPVLTARANVTKYPNDGETWGMLAKAYKQVFLIDRGYRGDSAGEELFKLSVEAYEKCLSLKPDDAQWHAGFADLLAHRAFWDSWVSGTTPETFRALEEINTALELAPNDPVVLEIAENITYLIPDGITQSGNNFDFPWLTQTPTALPPTPTMMPIDEPTATPLPTATDVAQIEPTRVNPTQANPPQTNPTAAPQRSTPFCGSAAFLPLLAVVWFTLKRK